jgi:hypothetical protein
MDDDPDEKRATGPTPDPVLETFPLSMFSAVNVCVLIRCRLQCSPLARAEPSPAARPDLAFESTELGTSR